MTLNIAHRGYSAKYPENTLLAFQKALDAKCQGIELDIQLTKDGQVVIFHDLELGRTLSGVGPIREYTLAELQQKAGGILFTGPHHAQIIPTLEDYFNLIESTDIFSVLELKNGVVPSPGLEEKVISLIEKFDLESRVVLSSFSIQSMRRCKILAPHIKTALISNTYFLKSYIRARKVKADFLNLRYIYINFSLIYLLRRWKIPIMVWTVNSPKTLTRFVNSKIYAIITNEPEILNRIITLHKNKD